MKQRELIKKLQKAGFKFERNGGNHDVYRRGADVEDDEDSSEDDSEDEGARLHGR